MLFKGRKEQAGSEASSPKFFWWAQHLYLFARAGPHYWTSSTGPQNSDVWYAKSFYILRFHSCLSVSVVWHENWSHQIIDSSISTLEQDTLKIKIAAGQPLVISQSTYLGIFSPLYSAASDKLSYNPKTLHCTPLPVDRVKIIYLVFLLIANISFQILLYSLSILLSASHCCKILRKCCCILVSQYLFEICSSQTALN